MEPSSISDFANDSIEKGKDFASTYGKKPSVLLAGAGFLASYAASQAQLAAGIQQQTGYMLQARDNLAIAQIKAELSDEYTQIQAGRLLQKANIEARNYQIAGSTLLRNARVTNAALRARAAAGGVAFGSGSAAAVQLENTRSVLFDVNIAELNALTASALGFEDATAMLQSADYQNYLNVYAARRQGAQFEQAGTAARRQGGLLARGTLIEGAVTAADKSLRTIPREN